MSALRVAIACDGDQVSPHFGRCEHYLVADVIDGRATVVDRVLTPAHEPGRLPLLIAGLQATCVVAGGAGPRAIDHLSAHGIQFIGGVSGPVKDALAQLAAGTLVAGDSTCDH